jgi:hypothetical protein
VTPELQLAHDLAAQGWDVDAVTVTEAAGVFRVALPDGRVVAESDSEAAALDLAFWTSPVMDYGTEHDEPPQPDKRFTA